MRCTFVAVGALGILIALAGCPPTEKSDRAGKDATPLKGEACSHVGQSCEVSPGKLGTCVQRDGCPEPASCFVCQSQH